METVPNIIREPEILTAIKRKAVEQGHPEFALIPHNVIKNDYGMSTVQFLNVLTELKNKSFIIGFKDSRSQVKVQVSIIRENLGSHTPLVPSNTHYDVFISHATKDKLSYVNALVNEIKKLGVKVFYDKDVLLLGDLWKNVIIEATELSDFAIIVISNNYFGREWTEKELGMFLRRQNKSGQKIVLPILYKTTRENMIEHYPSLEDIQCVDTSIYSKKDIALMLARILLQKYKN